jgi:hypothetical protein
MRSHRRASLAVNDGQNAYRELIRAADLLPEWALKQGKPSDGSDDARKALESLKG